MVPVSIIVFNYEEGNFVEVIAVQFSASLIFLKTFELLAPLIRQ